jgi:hypothetical protein
MRGTKGERATKRLIGLTAALIATGSLAAVGSAQAQVCSPAITACGCKIAMAGTYTINKNLKGTAGGVCVDIQAAHTILEFTSPITVTGAGSGTGIWIESTAEYTVVSGIRRPQMPPALGLGIIPPIPPIPGGRDEATITGFGYGIEDDANNTVIEFFHGLNKNTTAGLYLSGAQNVTAGNFCADRNTVAGVLAVGITDSRLFDFTTEVNTGDGVQMQASNNDALFNLTSVLNLQNGLNLLGSSNNSVATGSASQNALDGVVLGCNGNCDASSYANHITTFAAQGRFDNTGDNCESPPPFSGKVQARGIHIEDNNESNIVAGNFTGGNKTNDLQDDNDDCDSNVWTNNVFNTAFPSCTRNP